ncbi:MAG: nucleotide exchange factor GrpE [Gemmatimonadaceae bacterium]
MRHSRKKAEGTRLPEQDALGSADDFAPGGSDGSEGSRSETRSGQDVDDLPVEAANTADPSNETSQSDSTASANAPAAAESAVDRDRYLRLAAEYDNFRKRSAKERQDAGVRAQADLVRQLIDAVDDVQRFAHVDPATTDSATIVQGVDMVEKKLLKALSAAGLEIINPVGETFDPALHEAVATEPTSAREDDHVVSRVYQPGYLFKSQLLRPARVVVKQWNG